MLRPQLYYRPTRTPDGEGGFTEGFGDGAIVYAALQFHEDRITATVRAQGPLRVADVLEVDEAYYTVIGFTDTGAARYRQVLVEKRDRPIHR